ncbi:MAG: hypothetical protein ACRDV3_03530 [Acidothermaceae bacterium]
MIGLEIVFWWALMVGVWELTLAGTTLPEICCEVAAALLSALAAVAARRMTGGHWLPSPKWLRWLPYIAASVVVDTTLALRFAVTHGRHRDAGGRLTAVQLLRSDDGDDETHRAYSTLAISCTPGSVVYDADAGSHRLFAHALVDGPPDLEGAVAR